MAPRRRNTMPPKQFSPAANREVYRDILRFEERLRQVSNQLDATRRRYEAFLYGLIITCILSGYLCWITPSDSKYFYLYTGIFLVDVVTIILFFASGLYTEKISYAYKYIPSANRSFRPFNMYFSTSTSQRSRSIFSWLVHPFPSMVNPEPSFIHSSPPSHPSTTSLQSLRRSPTSSSSNLLSGSGRGPVALRSIPPSSNPRGEMVLGGKVPEEFQRGYQDFRTKWEEEHRPRREGWTEKVMKKVGRSEKDKGKGKEKDVKKLLGEEEADMTVDGMDEVSISEVGSSIQGVGRNWNDSSAVAASRVTSGGSHENNPATWKRLKGWREGVNRSFQEGNEESEFGESGSRRTSRSPSPSSSSSRSISPQPVTRPRPSTSTSAPNPSPQLSSKKSLIMSHESLGSTRHSFSASSPSSPSFTASLDYEDEDFGPSTPPEMTEGIVSLGITKKQSWINGKDGREPTWINPRSSVDD